MNIIIKEFPMPPSVNQMWASIRGRLIKTSIGRKYEKECHIFMHMKGSTIREWRTDIAKHLATNRAIAVDFYFVFHESRLFAQTEDKKTGRKIGDVKRLDVDNRLKPCIDELSKMLGIDDRYFFAGEREKLWCKSSENEQVIIRIRPHQAREIKELDI